MIQQEVLCGKKTNPSTGDSICDAYPASDHLPNLWKPHAHGSPQPSNGHHAAGSHTAYPQSVSLSQSSLFALPSANATGGRREVGLLSHIGFLREEDEKGTARRRDLLR